MKPDSKKQTAILHIEIGNVPITQWLNQNKYIIVSELVRYSEKLIKNDLEYSHVIMLSNLTDNVVFILRKSDIRLTLDGAMEYFLSVEAYEQCEKINDLFILISNKDKTVKNGGKIKKTNRKNQKVIKED